MIVYLGRGNERGAHETNSLAWVPQRLRSLLDSSIIDQQSGIQMCLFQPTVSLVPLGPRSRSFGPDDIAEA